MYYMASIYDDMDGNTYKVKFYSYDELEEYIEDNCDLELINYEMVTEY